MKRIGILLAHAIGIAALSALAACSSTNALDDSNRPSGAHPKPPTPEEVGSCKAACDQLKFFDCKDAHEQATCYADCDAATASQIELFVGCVHADICDPSCSTHITPAATTASSSVSGSGGSTGSSIGQGGSTATGMTDPAGACKDACETLQFFSCISAAQFSACSTLCDGSTNATAKQTFASCVEGGSVTDCKAVDCYDLFDPNAKPGPTPQEIANCKQSCSNLAFFDCISGSEAASCAAACDSLSKQDIEAFLICTMDPTDCAAATQCL